MARLSGHEWLDKYIGMVEPLEVVTSTNRARRSFTFLMQRMLLPLRQTSHSSPGTYV